MPQRFVPALGKSVAFPDSWTEQQIKDWVSQQSGGDGKTDIISSLKHGWKSGWADTADTYSDYKDALFRLLPGVDPKDGALDRASARLSESAQQEGVPDTLTEKIASGLGAVPAGLLGLLPAIGGTVLGTAATGNPIAGAALGFGMHGAVREQDQDLQGILEGAALGASEGAAFGALGKVLGPMKGLTGNQLKSKAIQHAVGTAGIGAGSNAVRQDMQTGEINPDDVIASGAIMGLLGLTPLAKGKLESRLPEMPADKAAATRLAFKQLAKDDPRLAKQMDVIRKRTRTTGRTPEQEAQFLIRARLEKPAWQDLPSERVKTSADEMRGVSDYLLSLDEQTIKSGLENGSVPAAEPYLKTRDTKFAEELNKGWKNRKPREDLDGDDSPTMGSGLEDARDAIRIGKRLGYRDGDIVKYLGKNYGDLFKSALNEATAARKVLAEAPALRKKTKIAGPWRTDFGLNMKFVPPESAAAIDMYKGGNLSVDELITKLKAGGDKHTAFQVESEVMPFAESFLKGKALDKTIMSIEDGRDISIQGFKLLDDAVAAERAGNPNAAQMMEQAHNVLNDSVVSLQLASKMRSAGGAYLGAQKALDRGIRLEEDVMLRLAKQKKLNTETMIQARELLEAGDMNGVRGMLEIVSKPTLKDKLHEWWKMGLLSNPLTWGITGVNAISNLSYAGLRPAFKAAAVPFDYLVSKTFGTQRTTTMADVKATFAGTRAGMNPALQAFIGAIKKEKPYQSDKIEMRHGPAIGGNLGKVVRFPGRALTAVDEFFRTLAQSQETAFIAREKLGRAPTVNEVSSLSKDIFGAPLKRIKEFNRITKAGNEAVFTTSFAERKKEHGLYKLAGTAGEFAQRGKEYGGLFGTVVEGAAPFVRTPTNVIIEALKMSPYGLWEGLKTLKRYEAAVASGAHPNQLAQLQRQLTYDLGRAAIGTSIFGIIHAQAEAGNITGGGPVDYDDYQKWIEAGNQPYSFKFGKDGPWVSYQRIEPFSSIFGAAADWHETKMEDENKLGRAWAAMKDNLANKTMLMGVETFAKAWADPKRYGESAYRNIASTFLPGSSALGWAARAIDPVARIQSVDAEHPFSSLVANTKSGMSSKIPGLRQTLEPRRSATGRLIEDEYSILNAFSPMKVAPSKSPSIVESELSRLTQAGFTMPTAEQRRRKVPGLPKTAVTTPEEYAKFAETNREASSVLERIMSTSSWSSLQDETKADIIDKVFKRYRRGSAAIVRESMRQRLSN